MVQRRWSIWSGIGGRTRDLLDIRTPGHRCSMGRLAEATPRSNTAAGKMPVWSQKADDVRHVSCRAVLVMEAPIAASIEF